MASEVDICNLALAHLGDTATVASIDPPEGSAQAELCARFYPVARDVLLELHPWDFSTRRATLAPLGSGGGEWDYAYAAPADALNILAVLPPNESDGSGSAGGRCVPQPFSCEMGDGGAQVILTDQGAATLRYTALVSDTTQFSPLFVAALSWQLAAMLAGPILKGDAGAEQAKRCEVMANALLARAAVSDAQQRRVSPAHAVGWIAGR